MKKQFKAIVSLAALLIIVAVSCAKKNDSNGIKPGYKADAGTGANPNAGNPTVTGSTTNTNLATQNSNLTVGGTGWSNPTCGTNSVVLQGSSGSTQVTLVFLNTPVTGTYAIGATPSSTACAMMVIGAPNQPVSIVWYGKSGVVNVNATATSITSNFSGVQCVQQTFNYPVVTVSGNVGCSQ